MVNGKDYPLWEGIIENKKNIIGKKMISTDMGFMGETIVEDIVLRPNGKKSAYFEIIGKDFSCGFDVQHGGITVENDKVVYSSFYGMSFYIED